MHAAPLFRVRVTSTKDFRLPEHVRAWKSNTVRCSSQARLPFGVALPSHLRQSIVFTRVVRDTCEEPTHHPALLAGLSHGSILSPSWLALSRAWCMPDAPRRRCGSARRAGAVSAEGDDRRTQAQGSAGASACRCARFGVGYSPHPIWLLAGSLRGPERHHVRLSANAVEFDHLLNQSSAAWALGAPSVVPLFAKGIQHVRHRMYAEELEDFAASNDHAALDEWVFGRTPRFSTGARSPRRTKPRSGRSRDTERAALEGERVVFLPMLARRTARATRTRRVWRRVRAKRQGGGRNGERRLPSSRAKETRGARDGGTTFLFTADHGMSSRGAHGDGDPGCTNLGRSWRGGRANPPPRDAAADDEARPRGWMVAPPADAVVVGPTRREVRRGSGGRRVPGRVRPRHAAADAQRRIVACVVPRPGDSVRALGRRSPTPSSSWRCTGARRRSPRAHHPPAAIRSPAPRSEAVARLWRAPNETLAAAKHARVVEGDHEAAVDAAQALARACAWTARRTLHLYDRRLLPWAARRVFWGGSACSSPSCATGGFRNEASGLSVDTHARHRDRCGRRSAPRAPCSPCVRGARPRRTTAYFTLRVGDGRVDAAFDGLRLRRAEATREPAGAKPRKESRRARRDRRRRDCSLTCAPRAADRRAVFGYLCAATAATTAPRGRATAARPSCRRAPSRGRRRWRGLCRRRAAGRGRRSRCFPSRRSEHHSAGTRAWSLHGARAPAVAVAPGPWGRSADDARGRRRERRRAARAAPGTKKTGRARRQCCGCAAPGGCGDGLQLALRLRCRWRSRVRARGGAAAARRRGESSRFSVGVPRDGGPAAARGSRKRTLLDLRLRCASVAEVPERTTRRHRRAGRDSPGDPYRRRRTHVEPPMTLRRTVQCRCRCRRPRSASWPTGSVLQDGQHRQRASFEISSVYRFTTRFAYLSPHATSCR